MCVKHCYSDRLLGLLCHLAEGHTGPIGVDEVERAISWGAYLESHAHRIYTVAVAPDMSEATSLAKKIRNSDLPDTFTLRDVYRKKWIGLTTRESAGRAVAILQDLDWLEHHDEMTGGRPRTTFAINPRIVGPTPTTAADDNDGHPKW